MEYIMPCIYAFIACLGFAITYNIRWQRMIPVCFGGALGWVVYLLLKDFGDVFAYFVATVVIAAYTEIMARVCKVPVIVFLTTAILPSSTKRASLLLIKELSQISNGLLMKNVSEYLFVNCC